MSTCSAAPPPRTNGGDAAGQAKGLGCDVQYDGAAIKFALAHKSEGGSVRAGEARVVVQAAPPYKCVGANSALCDLVGLNKEDITGFPLKILHDLDTRSVWDMAIETAAKESAPQDVRAMCNTASKEKKLMRVQVSVLQQDANVLADKEHKLMLLVLKPSSGLRSAQDVRSSLAPGARVIVKNMAPFPIESVSPDWQRMYGMAESAVVGRSLKVVQGPGTDSRAVSELMKAGARGVEGQAAFMTYTSEGKRLLTYHICLPLLSSTGAIESFMVEARSTDVVDFRDAVGMQKGMALVVALEGANGVVHASRELCKLLRKDADGLMGQPLSEILSGINAETLRKITTEAISGPPALSSMLVSLCIADAEPMPMRISVRPVFDAQLQFSHVLHMLEPCAVVSLSEAIANQKKNIDVDFIATAKAPFIVKHASKAWCGTYGLTEAEVTGRSLQIIHGPNTDKTVLNRMIEGAMAGAPSKETLTCYHKDGSAVKSSMIVYPVMSKNGAIEHLRAVIDDITFPDRSESPHRSKPDSSAIPPEHGDKQAANLIEYPITPQGHITHINGYTQLVLYPKADPTLKNCIVYLGKLKDASIVKGWNWEGDALKVNMDTQRVLAHTQKSAWCRMWTADLRTWDAWWNRMLWVVSEATYKQDGPDVASVSHGRDEGCDAHAEVDRGSANFKCKKGPLPLLITPTPSLHSALTSLARQLEDSGMSSSVCLVDLQGGIVFCNAAFSKIMKYSQKQLLGRSLFALCSDEVDIVEVKRIQMCVRTSLSSLSAHSRAHHDTEADKGLRSLTSCLEMRNGDGVAFWASIVGDPSPLGSRRGESCQDSTMESWALFCLSIEDCTDIVLPGSGHEGEVLNEVTDPYTFYMAEELSLLQNEALDAWKMALTDCEASTMCSDQTPAKDRGVLDEEHCRSKVVTICEDGETANKTSRIQYQKFLLQVPKDMRLRYVEELWQLKAQGIIKAWVWDSEYLSLTVIAQDMDSTCALDFCRMSTGVSSESADAKSIGSHFETQQSHSLLDPACSQTSDPRTRILDETKRWDAKTQEHEELHHHDRLALKLPEPGTDFAFLAADHEDADKAAAGCKGVNATTQQDAASKAMQSEETMESNSRHVLELRQQIAQLHLELAVEQSAKRSARAHAQALAKELQAVQAQSGIERSVSSMALQAMEASLYRKTGELEALQAEMFELKEENNNLNGILDLVRQQGEAAPSEDASDDAHESLSDDGFGHENADIQETRLEHSNGGKQGAFRPHSNGAMQVQESRMRMPLVSADVVERFRTYFSVDPVKTGFALCDESGAILWCNTRLTDAIGYKEEDLRWCRWPSLLCAPGTDEQAIERVHLRIKQRAPLSSCLQLCRQDGGIVWMHVRMEPAVISDGARDQDIPVFLLCVQPATDMERSSEQQAQVLEAAVIHGLDCVDVLSCGFPVQDTRMRRSAGNGDMPLETGHEDSVSGPCPQEVNLSAEGIVDTRDSSRSTCPSVLCGGEAPFPVLEVHNADKLYELTGYRRHEILGRSFSMFYGSSECQVLSGFMRRLSRSDAASPLPCSALEQRGVPDCLEAIFARKDGSSFLSKVILQARLHPCTDGSMASVVSAIFLLSPRSQSA